MSNSILDLASHSCRLVSIRGCNPALLCALFLAAGAHGADVRDGLVSYWPLDVNDAGTTPDWGAGNTMSIVGSPLVEPGQFNNAFTFDGLTTYLTNLHSPDNSITGLPIYRAASYTITMWVKGPAQTANYLYSEGSTTDNDPLLILQSGQAAANNAKFDVIIRNDAGGALVNHVVSTNVVFDDTWHHIAWVDDRGAARLYVDGNLDPANFSYTPSGTFTFNTAAIGTLVRATISTAAIFMGQIDDVAIWERALTQAEVQQVRANSLVTTPPYITRQPTGGTRGLGDRFTFTTRALGAPPFGYEWFKGAEPVPDAASSFLVLSNLTVADSGNYTVRITSGIDALTSEAATLTVLPDPAPDLRNGLISYWPMETIETDEFGLYTTSDLYSQNNMRLVTGSFFDQAPGAFGNSIYFNGVEQHGVRMGGFPTYNNPALTVSIWVNAGPQADRRFFCESTTNGNNNPLFAFGSHTSAADPRMHMFIRNNTGGLLVDRFSTRPVLDSNWHHVVWIENNGQAKLYIDGQLDETDFNYPRVPLTLDQTAVAAIVRAAVGGFFTGAIDELALWNRMLTFTEIQELHTNSVPAPIQPIPPQITQDPVSQSIFTPSRVPVTFSFTAIGTSPLQAQWRKGGVALDGQTNFTLLITNVMLSHAGGYDVIVANAAGSATSQVATLTVTLRPAPPSQLSVDFNNIAQETPADTEPGFSSFAITEYGFGPFTRSFGGTDVTLAAIGTTMESRKRATPVNSGAFTQERLLQDFIFTRDTTTDQGLDINVEFLKPNQPYSLTVWSFDTGSTGDRVSDWFANGAIVQSGWTFNGANLPPSNER